MHSENASSRTPAVRLHRSGSPLERNDDVLMYAHYKFSAGVPQHRNVGSRSDQRLNP
jgi:hypothetical protein